jgi:hypothetical protein
VRWRVSGRLGLAALAAAGLLGAAPASARLALDYLAIRGNEGGSAGGHAAIRFGAETFHFEHDGGLLRLKREDSLRFQHVYRTLQNRDIELSRVPVSRETYQLLRERFRLRALVQERQLAIEAELASDARLLEALRGSDPSLDVAGAGFFEPDAGSLADADADADAAAGELAALRRRIGSLHGEDFLARRRAETDLALARLAPETASSDEVALAADRYPGPPASFSRRAENALAARIALDLLARPRPLRPEALAPASHALALAPGERERLREVSAGLRESMARLAASRREDWGYPLLLGMARLSALEISLRSERLVVLDAFPAQSRRLEITPLRRSLLPGLLAEAQADLMAARERLRAAGGYDEADWSALEAAAARWLELRSAEAGASSIRVQAGSLLPEARARVPLSGPSRPAAPPEAALAQARASADRYRERLEALYRYDLVRRNCVSEIFRTLEAGLAQDAPAEDAAALREFVREESTRRLGGHVDPVAGFNFIPFVSSHRVRASWSVSERASLPSYRHHRLAEMKAREPWLLVALRESNVLTARSHRAADEEGFFLFYTDSGVPARPLLGALNLGAGLLRSALAVAQLPFDGGRALRSGLTGVVFSLPELLFQNIRKGYNDYVPPGERPPPG